MGVAQIADRDTTSTPFKLSADGLTYFRYPNGNAPVVQVADYAELRTKGQADTSTGRISVSGQYIKGVFVWRPESPFHDAAADDGGVVIAATGGVWERVSALQNGVYSLDWYAPADGFSWTPVLKRLFAEARSSITFHCPTQSSYGELDHTVILVDSVSFYATTPYRFQQTAYADDDNDFTKLRQLEFFSKHIYLGSNVEFFGRMENKLRGRGTGQEHSGLIHVHMHLLQSFDFHGRITEPRSSAALNFENNGTNSWENFKHVRMSGLVTSGTVGSSVMHTAVIPLVELLPGFEIADPNGGSLGIDWSAPDPLTAPRIPERSVNLDMGLADRFEGEMISRWGGSAYSTVTGGKNGIGTAEKPLTFYMVDKGFLADYPEVTLDWYSAQNGTGKFDGYDNSTALDVVNAPVYIDYVYRGKCRVGRDVVWEASGQSAGEYKYVQGFHIRHFLEMPESSYSCLLRGLQSFIGWDTSEDPADGYIRHNSIEGTFASIHLQDGPNTLRNIVLMGSDYVDVVVFQIERPWEWGAGNSIGPITVDGMTFRTTCYSRTRQPMIQIDEGAVTITDLVMDAPFTPQSAPFGSLGCSEAIAGLGPVVLNLINPALRTGARFEVAAGAVNPSITFMIDGITQTLPWTAP